MIESIFIARSGLQGYSTGLQVIANNTANLNTPGFKGSSLLFADMYAGSSPMDAPGADGLGQRGLGLDTLGTMLSFKQGQFQATTSGLDLAVDGLGLFVLRNPTTGQVRYTRDGQFKFNSDGILVTSDTEEQVLGLDANGELAPFSIADLRVNTATPTTKVTFGGNLSVGSKTATVGNVTVFDRAGTSHTLSVRLKAVDGTDGAWTATVLDGTKSMDATGQLQFNNGVLDPAHSQLSFSYEVAGQEALPITLDFSQNVTSYGSDTINTLAVANRDGNGPGSMTGTAFDETGTLVLSYSNGQTVKGSRIALARFESIDAVKAVGDNRFEAVDTRAWTTGYAKDNGFGSIKSGNLEMSNVDLSSEFSDLVIMQRGYQASSQVISTASEMMATLFGMSGGK